MAITNGTLATKINDLIDFWNGFRTEYENWLGGTVGGGPNSDGEYLLTDYAGNSALVKSPAKLQDDVDNIVTGASAHKTAAEAAQTAAETAQTAAELAETNTDASEALALAYRDAALAAQSAAETARSTAIAQAANTAADALNTAADAVTTAADVVLTNADVTYTAEWANKAEDSLVSVAAGGDGVDDYSAMHHAIKAAASAAAAATWDPVNYAALADAETITGAWTFGGNIKLNDDVTLTFGTDNDAVFHWDSVDGELKLNLLSGRLDMDADIRFTTANGINAERDAGLCNLDLDSLVADGTSDAYIRVGRSTTTTGSSFTQWFKGDGTAGVGMEFEHDNATDSSYLTLKGDGDVVLTLTADEDNSGEGDNPWIKFDQDGGAVGSMIGHAGSGAVKPDGTTFTGGNSNDLIIAQDGDGSDICLGGADGVVLKVVCTDDVNHGLRIYDNDHSTYASIYHKNTTLDFVIKSDASSPILIQQQAQGGIWHDVQLAADDETITFSPGTDGGIVMIVASSTSNTETGGEAMFMHWSGTAMFDMHDTRITGMWDLGGGTNSDVDGRHNVWRSADSVLSIKNRRGSSRYYSVYLFGGL